MPRCAWQPPRTALGDCQSSSLVLKAVCPSKSYLNSLHFTQSFNTPDPQASLMAA
jgi:hypothetical protein